MQGAGDGTKNVNPNHNPVLKAVRFHTYLRFFSPAKQSCVFIPTCPRDAALWLGFEPK